MNTSSKPTLLLVNGPNLSRLGSRKPEIYGHVTLSEIEADVQDFAAAKNWAAISFQSNHEGAIIDFLEENRSSAALILNPGALMMSGWSLRDALEDFPAPWIEVHLSNVWSREIFRHKSVISPFALGVIAGFGSRGYRLAAIELIDFVTSGSV